ncbi:hypothetical protein [Nocardia sp. NBC_01388]
MNFIELADVPMDKLTQLEDSPLTEAVAETETEHGRMRFSSAIN